MQLHGHAWPIKLDTLVTLSMTLSSHLEEYPFPSAVKLTFDLQAI